LSLSSLSLWDQGTRIALSTSLALVACFVRQGPRTLAILSGFQMIRALWIDCLFHEILFKNVGGNWIRDTFLPLLARFPNLLLLIRIIILITSVSFSTSYPVSRIISILALLLDGSHPLPAI
jgi:hypothetical protein